VTVVSTEQAESDPHVSAFEAEGPVSAKLELVAGRLRIRAGAGSAVTVSVRPIADDDPADVAMAGKLRVDFHRGALSVRLPALSLPGMSQRAPGNVEVLVELPAGSDVRASSRSATLVAEGRLGELRYETMYGDIHVDEVVSPRLTTAEGDITVSRMSGRSRIASGSGTTSVGRIEGTATIGNDHGDVRVGDLDGKLRLVGIRGEFAVDRCSGDVKVKILDGRASIGEVVRGSVTMSANSADLEIGISPGTAARLDIGSVTGHVTNALTSVSGPDTGDEVCEITARTYCGDIVIRRAPDG
jgi:Putative adhesin